MMENAVWLAFTQSHDLSAQARELLRLTLGKETLPPLQYDAHGKPYLEGMCCFSISHTRGAVAAAVSQQPVGVDVERADRQIPMKLRQRYLTAAEQAYAADAKRFLEIWTRKEALLKRDGRLQMPFRMMETCGRPDIVTAEENGFLFSFCGQPASFRLVIVSL